ncbi:hypothetical protein JXA48_03630 [Candidatus Woesearchaeota archaeon]|nr:hypothetical protein [Candidatus Woesearchaeota archaeon]
MWNTSKFEVIIYLVLGFYIATPSSINVFYKLINYFSKGASQTTLELFVFLKLFVSIIGAIIVVAAAMDIYNKIKGNEFA